LVEKLLLLETWMQRFRELDARVLENRQRQAETAEKPGIFGSA